MENPRNLERAPWVKAPNTPIETKIKVWERYVKGESIAAVSSFTGVSRNVVSNLIDELKEMPFEVAQELGLNPAVLALHMRIADASSTVPEIQQVIQKIKEINIEAGDECFSLQSCVLAIHIELGLGQCKYWNLAGILEKRLGGHWNAETMHSLLARLKRLGVIDSLYHEPAPGSTTSIRKSLLDVPGNNYILTDLGGQVVEHLLEAALDSRAI